MPILGLFDAVVVEVKNNLSLFRLALAILCHITKLEEQVSQINNLCIPHSPSIFSGIKPS